MRYLGQTYSIPCERGGLNASVNKTLMPPESMVVGSKNLNLKGARKKRGGTARVNANPIGATLVQNGGFASDTTGWTAGNFATLASVADGKAGNCLRITCDGNAAPYARQDITVTAGNFYRFQGYVKAGTEATYYISLYDLTNSTTIWSTEAEEIAGDWSTVAEKEFVAPTGCETVRITLRQKAAIGAGTTLFYDSITLKQIPSITGLFDFLKPAGSQFIVFATDDGRLWKNTTTTIKTGLTVDKFVSIEQFGSKAYFCNGADVPTVWDGAAGSTTDLTVGVAAQGTITMAGIATAEETFAVDDQTFTWKVARSVAGEVTIGADAPAAVTNIVTAITADLETVTAVDGAGDTVVVTAASEGTAGNSIVFTEASTNMTVDGSGTLGTTTAGVNDQVPSDWTGSNYPAQMIRHGRGNSERLWAIGCLSTPYTVYASKNGDGSDFSDANVTTINIDTGDGYGIVGAHEFGDKIFCFGRRQTYIIDDADTNVSNWGYDAAPWEGGVAHWRLIIRTPNDLVCMAEDGEIYSVMAAAEYGDYKKASLTRATYLHDWIKDNLKLSYISRFHGVYDPVLRAIKIFVVRTGQTLVDTALVYFIDRPPAEAWMIHDNLNFASGHNASCSALIRVGAGDYQIYTGDYSGFIWKLEQSAKNDNAQAFWAGFKTSPLGLNDERLSERYDRGWLILEPQGTEVLSIDWWTSGTSQTSTTITAVSGTRRYPFKLKAMGENIELQIYNNTKDTDFYINELQLDFIPLGAKLK